MKCPKCKGKGYLIKVKIQFAINGTECPICKGTGKVERSDGIDYNRKIAVPEHKAGQSGG